ncbi:MAG: fluoride efflux transporter CrcB [Candidatus Eutrophobiaceae bacterium]
MSLPQLLCVACGGALGALLRYGMNTAMMLWLGRATPWGTFTVNVLGSFLMGLLVVWIVERHYLGELWRLGLIVGALGSFTTFSAFSWDTLALWQAREYAQASLYMGASLFGCLLACTLGMWFARGGGV